MRTIFLFFIFFITFNFSKDAMIFRDRPCGCFCHFGSFGLGCGRWALDIKLHWRMFWFCGNAWADMNWQKLLKYVLMVTIGDECDAIVIWLSLIRSHLSFVLWETTHQLCPYRCCRAMIVDQRIVSSLYSECQSHFKNELSSTASIYKREKSITMYVYVYGATKCYCLIKFVCDIVGTTTVRMCSSTYTYRDDDWM